MFRGYRARHVLRSLLRVESKIIKGDKNLQNELRSKAYACRPAAVDVKRRGLYTLFIFRRQAK